MRVKRKGLWAMGFVAALVFMAGWALRPGPNLVVPGFTEGKAESFVVQDRVTGWRKITTYRFERPWDETVRAFGAAMEARGYRRAPPALHVWVLPDGDGWKEATNVEGFPTVDPKRTTVATGVTQNRAATTGEVVADWILARLPRRLSGRAGP